MVPFSGLHNRLLIFFCLFYSHNELVSVLHKATNTPFSAILYFMGSIKYPLKTEPQTSTHHGINCKKVL